MTIIKQQSIKERINQILLDRGYNPGEIQISKSGILLLSNFLNKELEDIINKAVNYIIGYNAKSSYKKLKRITSDLLQNIAFSNVDVEVLKSLTSVYQKPQQTITSENDASLGRLNP